MFNRFQNIFWFFWLLLFKKSAKKVPKKPKKIIFVYMGKLGDMVCITPVFRAVKEKYPNIEIIVFGDNVNKNLLEGNLDVDQYYIFSNIKTIISDLKSIEPDFGIIISPDFKFLISLLRANVPGISVSKVVGGFTPYETRPYKILRSKCFVAEHQMGNYAPGEYFRLLEPLRIPFPENARLLSKNLYFSKEAGEKMEKVVLEFKKNSEKVVGVMVSTGNKIKEWPKENFVGLIKRIKENYNFTVLLLGTKNDLSLANEINKEVEVKNLAGVFNLDEFKALVSKIDLVIGVDTGPIYVAEAFGTPTIDILGPMAENEQPPIGAKHLVVKIEREKPELHIMNARVYDWNEARRQIEEISPELVFEAFKKLFPIEK